VAALPLLGFLILGIPAVPPGSLWTLSPAMRTWARIGMVLFFCKAVGPLVAGVGFLLGSSLSWNPRWQVAIGLVLVLFGGLGAVAGAAVLLGY
jgi:hypothetical protein